MVSVSDPNMMHLKGGTLEYFTNNIAITKRTLVSPEKQRSRGRVTIAEEKNSYHEIKYSDLSSSAMWYKTSELTAFRKHVIEKIRLFNENMYDEETQDICGLMGHPSMKHRAKAKERAIRHILKSQGMGAEILGLVARYATRSAKMIAYGQGIQDSCASKRSIEESSSLSFENKAAVADDDSNICKRKYVNCISRSVRRRTESDSI